VSLFDGRTLVAVTAGTRSTTSIVAASRFGERALVIRFGLGCVSAEGRGVESARADWVRAGDDGDVERASAAERSADCGSLESVEGVGGLAGLADTRLWCASARQGFPAGRLIGHRVSPSLIAEQWDEMLRLAARPNRAWSPPACWLGRLRAQQRGPRSPTPCWTTGRGWSRPSSSCYLTAPYDRRSVHRPLNKGESISVLETPSSAATKARRYARVATRADAGSARSSTAGGPGDHRVAGAVGRSLFTTDFRCEVTITATRTSHRGSRARSGLGLWRGSDGDGVLV
jgi:hypothetical protein